MNKTNLLALKVLIGCTISFACYSPTYSNQISGQESESEFIQESKLVVESYNSKNRDPKARLAIYGRCSVYSQIFQHLPKAVPQSAQFSLPSSAYVDLSKATASLIGSSFKDKDAAVLADQKNMERTTDSYRTYITNHYLGKKENDVKEDISKDPLIQADYEMCSGILRRLK